MAGKSKIIEKVTGALGDLIDRRSFLKGAAGTAALGALPTAARIAQKTGAEEVLPVASKTLAKVAVPADIYDLPIFEYVNNVLKDKTWEMMVRKTGADSVLRDLGYGGNTNKEIVGELLKEKKLTFDDVNIDPDNITEEDLLNPSFMQETRVANRYNDMSGAESDISTMSYEDEDILAWLNDEIPLNRIGLGEIVEGLPQYRSPFAQLVLEELQSTYNMSKPEIKKYLERNAVLPDPGAME